MTFEMKLLNSPKMAPLIMTIPFIYELVPRSMKTYALKQLRRIGTARLMKYRMILCLFLTFYAVTSPSFSSIFEILCSLNFFLQTYSSYTSSMEERERGFELEKEDLGKEISILLCTLN